MKQQQTSLKNLHKTKSDKQCYRPPISKFITNPIENCRKLNLTTNLGTKKQKTTTFKNSCQLNLAAIFNN